MSMTEIYFLFFLGVFFLVFLCLCVGRLLLTPASQFIIIHLYDRWTNNDFKYENENFLVQWLKN